MSQNNRGCRNALKLRAFVGGIAAGLIVAGEILVPSAGMAASTDPPYALVTAVPPPGGDLITSFDISFVNPTNVVAGRRKYYIANRTSKAIIVVDTVSNTVVN